MRCKKRYFIDCLISIVKASSSICLPPGGRWILRSKRRKEQAELNCLNRKRPPVVCFMFSTRGLKHFIIHHSRRAPSTAPRSPSRSKRSVCYGGRHGSSIIFRLFPRINCSVVYNPEKTKMGTKILQINYYFSFLFFHNI